MATQTPAKGSTAPPQQAPFRAGTQETVLNTGYVQSVTMTTSTQDLPVWQIPPSNIIRGITLEVSGSVPSSNTASTAFATDAPLNIFSTVNFTDAGGTSIVGSFDSFTLAMAQKYFGYAANPDMKNSAVYSVTTGTASTGGNFNEVFTIPVEIVNRTGFGSLQNQSTNSPLELNLTLNSSGNVYTTAPEASGSTSDLPVVTVRASVLGYWKGSNTAAAQTPKNYGTTQYINRATYLALDGSVTLQLSNLGLGNKIRNLMFLNYATGSSRSSSDFPSPVEFDFRGNKLFNMSQNLWNDLMSRWYGYSNTTADAALGLNAGVFNIPFNKDFVSTPGEELGAAYLSTNVGDALQLVGTWNGSSTLYELVNFIAVKGATTAPAAS